MKNELLRCNKNNSKKKNGYKYIKRGVDILISLVALIVFILPMIVIAIAIKLESKGPALFKQKRTGKNGQEFNLYKFRSMTQDNDVMNFKSENKITKVGRFIRKTSLDELPQVLNILKGDMSWIGPRPWIVEYYNNFTEEQKRRVEVLPGITGLAQAYGRNNLSIFDKIKYDIEYVDHYSLKMDLKVIFLTIKTILSKEGAELSKSGIKEELDELRANYIYVTSSLPIVEENYEEEKKITA